MNQHMTMMDYILLQPETMQEIFDNRQESLKDFLAFYQQVQPDHVYIIASGSSYNASCAASVYMSRAMDVDVTVHCPSQVCDRRLPIGCRVETVGPKTMGYTATIYTFSLLALEAGFLSGKMDADTYAAHVEMFSRVPEDCRENIARTDAFTMKHLDAFSKMQKMAFVGKGVGGEMAKEGALKVLETLLVPAIHYEYEEYLHGPLCAIDDSMAGFYMIAEDGDKERMLKVAQAHQEMNGCAYIITGDEAIRGEHVLNLVTSGDDATVPFEVILLPQFISSEVPVNLGTVNKGMAQFRKFDDLVKMKAKR